jgi:hypothetical protein
LPRPEANWATLLKAGKGSSNSEVVATLPLGGKKRDRI